MNYEKLREKRQMLYAFSLRDTCVPFLLFGKVNVSFRWDTRYLQWRTKTKLLKQSLMKIRLGGNADDDAIENNQAINNNNGASINDE